MNPSPPPRPIDDGTEWPSADDPTVHVIPGRFMLGDMLRFLFLWAHILFVTAFCSLLPGFMLAEAVLPEYDPDSAAPPLHAPLTFLVAALITGLVIWLLLATRRRVYKKSWLQVSPVGVEVHDHLGAVLRLRWEDVTGIERVRRHPIATLGGIMDRRSASMTPNYGAEGQRAHPADAIVGLGTVTVPRPEPKQWRKVLDRSTLADRKRGLYMLGFRFGAVGPIDATNPLVVYTQRYRPDLFEPLPPVPPGVS